jgi:hypothetical protein
MPHHAILVAACRLPFRKAVIPLTTPNLPQTTAQNNRVQGLRPCPPEALLLP